MKIFESTKWSSMSDDNKETRLFLLARQLEGAFPEIGGRLNLKDVDKLCKAESLRVLFKDVPDSAEFLTWRCDVRRKRKSDDENVLRLYAENGRRDADEILYRQQDGQQMCFNF